MHLLVRVGDERYALGVGAVTEVGRVGMLTPVPGAPRAVRGVQSLRGQVLPVIDLGAVLGMSPSGERGDLVVVEDAGGPVGLAVDALLDVEIVETEASAQPAGPLLGSALLDGVLFGVLDVPGALRLARGAS